MAERTKRELAKERRARRKELKAPSRRCFWTWPCGHLWDITGRFTVTCAYCGKRSLI